MAFNDELLAWRKIMGLTQAQAAEKFGVPPTTYRNWEYAEVQKMPGAAAKLFETFKSPTPKGETQ
jgi:transcriptional regulator with XRE-family HTH domain